MNVRHYNPPNAWQPIETAPKDGTDVLLYGIVEDYGPVADWEKEHFVGSWYRSSSSGEGEWLANKSECGTSHPTHWMPLPAPPEVKK